MRVPCHRAHFYHMRHSFREYAAGQSLNMFNLVRLLNAFVFSNVLFFKLKRKMACQNKIFSNFRERLKTTLGAISKRSLNSSMIESLNDFDTCVKAINEEHFTLKVSRCMTPHACNLRLKRFVSVFWLSMGFAFFHTFFVGLWKKNSFFG